MYYITYSKYIQKIALIMAVPLFNSHQWTHLAYHSTSSLTKWATKCCTKQIKLSVFFAPIFYPDQKSTPVTDSHPFLGSNHICSMTPSRTTSNSGVYSLLCNLLTLPLSVNHLPPAFEFKANYHFMCSISLIRS